MKKLIILVLCVFLIGCIEEKEAEPKSASGVKKASAIVKTGSDGLTVEQRNIKNRLEEENKPGSIKHLYIISAYSGQVILYSTVKGKVTSSGKRLTPVNVGCTEGEYVDTENKGIMVNIGGNNYRTPEVLQDDGTYGYSIPYLYWWDTKGIYHQHYICGGQIPHVSNQPISVPKIILNLEELSGE